MLKTNIKRLTYIIILSINFLNLIAIPFEKKIKIVRIVPDNFYIKKIADLFNPFIGDLKSPIFREKIWRYLQERFNMSYEIIFFKNNKSDEFMELFGSEIKYLYPNGPSILQRNFQLNERFIEFQQAYSRCLEEIVSIREQIIYQRYYDDALRPFERRLSLIKCTICQFRLEVKSASAYFNTSVTPIELFLIKESNVFSAIALKSLRIY